MNYSDEFRIRKRSEDQIETENDQVTFEEGQELQRAEVGEDIINNIKNLVYEQYPEFEGIDPTISDENVERIAENILERLRELKTETFEVPESQRAWKSLLFAKELSEAEMILIQRVIAVINRNGDLLRLDESLAPKSPS